MREQKIYREDSEKYTGIQRDRTEMNSNKDRAGDETDRRDEMKGGQKLF